MKVGDLVRHNRPTTRDEGKAFLVLETKERLGGCQCWWVRLDSDSYAPANGWCSSKDLEVVSEGR